MPTSGGTYVYLERCFGPLAGTVAGLGLWLSLLLKSAFALVGFGAYLNLLAPRADPVPTSLAILAFIVLLNIAGVGKVSGVLMAVVGACIAVLGMLYAPAVLTVEPRLLTPLLPNGIEGLLAGTALVFVSYAGVTKVAAIAEEIDRPGRNLPQGIIVSLLSVSLLYSLTAFLLVGNFPLEVLGGHLRPIHLLAQKVGGKGLETLVAVVAIATMSSMANAGILAASRFPFAMGRDSLLPSFLGSLSGRFLTPVNAILLSGAIVGVAVAKLDVLGIAKLASAFILMIYMAENAAVIVLRETRVQWYRPSYRSVLYPYTQIFGVLLHGGAPVLHGRPPPADGAPLHRDPRHPAVRPLLPQADRPPGGGRDAADPQGSRRSGERPPRRPRGHGPRQDRRRRGDPLRQGALPRDPRGEPPPPWPRADRSRWPTSPRCRSRPTSAPSARTPPSCGGSPEGFWPSPPGGRSPSTPSPPTTSPGRSTASHRGCTAAGSSTSGAAAAPGP